MYVPHRLISNMFFDVGGCIKVRRDFRPSPSCYGRVRGKYLKLIIHAVRIIYSIVLNFNFDYMQKPARLTGDTDQLRVRPYFVRASA